MNLDILQKQISFIKEIDKLKYVTRKTRLFNSDRHENDAEHSWHLAMMVLVLAEHSNEPIDMLKVLKMILIHDIVEIDAGDTFLFDTKNNHTNTDEELKAAKRIFRMLPKVQADDFIAIWEEFEAFETPEAKFARSIDHFEPILQNDTNNGGTWAEFAVPYETVIQKKSVMKKGSSNVWNYAKSVIDENQKNGIFKDEV
ncbi:MAG: HD domain-containing protein [Cyclobacteriaceae bacterium]